MTPSERQQRPISTDMLSAFLKVAHSSSVSQAAVALDVSKSLVSKRIAQLEERLGATLFSRSTRKIALTPAGEAYLEFAQRAVNEISGGLERVRVLKTELTGTLRLTAPVSWGQRVLAKQLPDFLRLHAALEIELRLADRVMDIAAERIDIAFRWSSAAGPELRSTPMTTVEWFLTASPLYVSVHGVPAAPRELANHSCLYYRRDSSDDTWTLISEGAKPDHPTENVTVKVNGRYRVDNPEAVYESAVAGLGVALLPDYLCEDAIRNGRLVKVLSGWTAKTKFGTQVVALSTPERMKFTRNQVLLDYLKLALGDRTA
jgi:DNA-binding transcriptional LysR family regulator